MSDRAAKAEHQLEELQLQMSAERSLTAAAKEAEGDANRQVQVTEARLQQSEAERSLSQATLSELQRKLQGSELGASEAEIKLQELQSEVDALATKAQSSTVEAQAMRLRAEAAEANATTLEVELQEAKQKLAMSLVTEQKLSSALNAELRAANIGQESMEAERQAVIELKAKLEDAETRLQKAETKQTEAQTELQRLAAMLEEGREHAAETYRIQASRHAETLQKRDNRLDELAASQESLRLEYIDARARLSTAERERDLAQEAAASAINRVQAAEIRAAESTSRLEDAEANVAAIMANQSKLTEAIAELQEAKAEADSRAQQAGIEASQRAETAVALQKLKAEWASKVTILEARAEKAEKALRESGEHSAELSTSANGRADPDQNLADPPTGRKGQSSGKEAAQHEEADSHWQSPQNVLITESEGPPDPMQDAEVDNASLTTSTPAVAPKPAGEILKRANSTSA